LGWAGQPLVIIGAALYLASDASRYTNGAVIKVVGGMVYGN
jgi:NAD(P)-dependent dehydrogenase (short-subunit alcohol dehydrogenase family)